MQRRSQMKRAKLRNEEKLKVTTVENVQKEKRYPWRPSDSRTQGPKKGSTRLEKNDDPIGDLSLSSAGLPDVQEVKVVIKPTSKPMPHPKTTTIPPPPTQNREQPVPGNTTLDRSGRTYMRVDGLWICLGEESAQSRQGVRPESGSSARDRSGRTYRDEDAANDRTFDDIFTDLRRNKTETSPSWKRKTPARNPPPMEETRENLQQRRGRRRTKSRLKCHQHRRRTTEYVEDPTVLES